jgi:hypothetical protein
MTRTESYAHEDVLAELANETVCRGCTIVEVEPGEVYCEVCIERIVNYLEGNR